MTIWCQTLSRHDIIVSSKGPMMESKVFICASAAELQQWLRHLEDRRCKSMTRPTSPFQCALSYLVKTEKKGSEWKIEYNDMYLTVAMWWALEERRTEDVLNAGTNLAVGGFSNTAHGSTWICIHDPACQYTETGDDKVLRPFMLYCGGSYS